MSHTPVFSWIADRESLTGLARRLGSLSEIALDSEANSGFVYQERLCLLQVSDGNEVWLIDLLALPNDNLALEPLRALLEDPDVRICLHGGEFDVGCLKRDYGIAVRGVWDSQRAASFLGWEKTGYGSVVGRVCGIDLPKEHAHRNWGIRPIESAALSYAVNDVYYLLEVGRQLRSEVIGADLVEEVELACRAVEAATWNGGYSPDGVWSLKGAGQLSIESRPLLFALYAWRDGLARRLDLPPGRALNSQLLIALCRNPPRRESELRRLGVPRRVLSRHAAELLEVIAEARRAPPVLPPRPTRKSFDRQAQERGERLKSWRREEAERRGVPLQVVLPVSAMKHLQSHGCKVLEEVPQLGEKRIRLYGDELRRLCEV